MLVAIYARMSTDKQESSIERQLDQVNKHIAAKGYTVYKVYKDEALKGYDWERPAFLELMADARNKRFSGIIVDEESRFSRNKALKFIARIAEPLSDLGIWLESVSEGRQDWDDMAGLIMTTIRAEKSNSESANLGRRILSKWCLMASKGECYLGRQPYGYRYVLDGKGKRVSLLPNEGEAGEPDSPANVIRWLFRTYLDTDTSLRNLANELTRRAVPTAAGGTWKISTISKFLKDRVYCGDYRFNRRRAGKFYRMSEGSVVTKVVGDSPKRQDRTNPVEDWVIRTDSHPSLINRDDYVSVQAKLVRNCKWKASPREMGKFAFMRLLVCSHCGGHMVGMTRRRNGMTPRVAYVCGTNHRVGTCRTYSVFDFLASKIGLGILSFAATSSTELAACQTRMNCSGDTSYSVRPTFGFLLIF